MIQIISHRGLLDGLNPQLENCIDQIEYILDKTPFGVEFDIRSYKDEAIRFGHDWLTPKSHHVFEDPQLIKVLSNPRSLVHCKNEWTAVYMREKYPASEIFDHDKEAWAKTSKGRIIAHFCGIFDKAIWNQPEKWYENRKYAINSSFKNVLEACLANKIKPCAILTKYPYDVQKVLDNLGKYYDI